MAQQETYNMIIKLIPTQTQHDAKFMSCESGNLLNSYPFKFGTLMKPRNIRSAHHTHVCLDLIYK